MIKDVDVLDQNPWWKGAGKIYTDEKIQKWSNAPARFTPSLKQEIEYDYSPDNTVVYTLRGPRQVGKTTMVKLQIMDFIKQGIAPWNIFYCSLDLASTRQDVVDAVEIYMRMSSRQRGNRRTYLFLDEVSTIDDWQKGIKWLVDGGKLRNCTVLATGSQAINLRNASERLPGRRGVVKDNHDKILLPMKFAEYASLLNNDVNKVVTDLGLSHSSEKDVILSRLLNREIDDKIDKLCAYQGELDGLLCEYMLTGGTPLVINEKIRAGILSENLYANYLDGIRGDWSKLAKNEILLKQFGGTIVKCQGSHTSWTALSRESDLGSPNTASGYADTLHDLFVLSIIHRYHADKKIPMLRKNRKFYFRDPFFLHIFNGWMSPKDNFDTSLEHVQSETNQGMIVEGVVADHLIRLSFNRSLKKQTFDYFNHVFYWKDKKNREVDFVLYDGDTTELPIEVKFRNKINHRELGGLVSFLDCTGSKAGGLVLSKSTLDVRSDYVLVPASIFLLLV